MVTETEKSSTILLVEDHADSLAMMDKILRMNGYKVLTASSCQSAIEATREECVDVLVCDVGLPDGDGLALMQKLIEENKAKKSIILSGYAMPDEVRKIDAAGCDFHMSKPLDFEKLLHSIALLIRGIRPVDGIDLADPTPIL